MELLAGFPAISGHHTQVKGVSPASFATPYIGGRLPTILERASRPPVPEPFSESTRSNSCITVIQLC